MEFLRDDRVRWVGQQPGCGKIVEQDWKDRFHGRRRDGIAEANIDLRLAASIGQFARDDHADAPVAGFLSDLFDRDRSRVECHTVIHSNGGNVAEGFGHRYQIARTEAEQIGVASGPMWHVVSEREEQRALEQKTISVLRSGQAVENAFQRKTHQHLIEIHTLRFGDIELSRTDGRGDVGIGEVHPMLSR